MLAGCQGHLPRPPRRESPDTPFNTRTMLLRGHSSNGTYSNVRQVNTGPNSFSFVETWFLGGRTVHTAGQGTYEPSSHTNIDRCTKPKGVVVVTTVHGSDHISSVDTVLHSSLPLFRPGDRITYEPRP